jgi:hypothetical protein
VAIVSLLDYGEAVEIHGGPDPDLKYIASIAFLLPGSNAEIVCVITNLANDSR